MNVTYARQGTEQSPIMWEICWDGAGWYAGADNQTVKLRASNAIDASEEAHYSGLGTATYHESEADLIAAHGNNW